LSEQGSAASHAPGRTRRYTRHRLDARIQMSVFRDGATISLWGCTSELGQDGVGATLSAQLKVGEVVSMEFPIPVPPHFLRVRAIARYCEGLRCGFEFLIVTEGQRETLRRCCEVLASAS
jgi:hypothetical protein